MTARRLAPMTALLLALGLPSAALATPDGGYFALGLGAASVSGDRGVPLDGFFLNESLADYPALVRTDFDGGMAIELRFGYLIEGLVAPEIAVHGHGSFDFDAGAGQVTFNLRYHPLEHFIAHDSRAFDANLYVGAGYAIAGFHPDEDVDEDGKGWEGMSWSLGLGFGYQLGDRVSLGLDLKVVLPRYATYIWDRDDGREYEAPEAPETLFVVPSLQLVFHL